MLLIVGNGIIACPKIASLPSLSSSWAALLPIESTSTLGDVGGLVTGIATLLLFGVLMMSAAQELFEERPPDESGWENTWEARDGDTKSEILAAMNFFEIVAGEYNDLREYLDKKAAQKALLVIADGLWDQAAPFVYWARKGSDPRSYEQWEKMSRRADRTVLPLRTTETESTRGAEARAPESPALGPPELINNVVEACQAVVNDLTALAKLTDPSPDDLLQLGRDLQSVRTERERLPPSGMRVKVIDLVRLVRPVLRSEARATRELVTKVAAAFDAVKQARESLRRRKY